MAEIVYGFFCRHCGASLAEKRNRRNRSCRLCGHERDTLAFRCICGQARLGGNCWAPHAECRRLLQLEKDDPILQCWECISGFIQSVAKLMQQIQATDNIEPSCSSTPSRLRVPPFSVRVKKQDAIADISAIKRSSVPELLEQDVSDPDIALLVEILSFSQYERRMEQLGEAEQQYLEIQTATSSYARGRLAKLRANQHICTKRSTTHDLKPPYTSWLFTNEVDVLMSILVKRFSTVQVLNCQESMESVAKSIASPRRLTDLPVVVPVIVNCNHFVLVIRSTDDRVTLVDSKSSGSEGALRSLKSALRLYLTTSRSKLQVSHHYLGQQDDHFSCGHWVVQLARLAAVVGLTISEWPGYIVGLKSKWSDVIRDHHEILAARRLASFSEQSFSKANGRLLDQHAHS